jgi:hypothetical protein
MQPRLIGAVLDPSTAKALWLAQNRSVEKIWAHASSGGRSAMDENDMVLLPSGATKTDLRSLVANRRRTMTPSLSSESTTYTRRSACGPQAD